MSAERKHTPFYNPFCGCSTERNSNRMVTERCPLHDAAPQMLEALEDAIGAHDEHLDIPWGTVRAAIRAAKGEA